MLTPWIFLVILYYYILLTMTITEYILGYCQLVVFPSSYCDSQAGTRRRSFLRAKRAARIVSEKC